MGNEFELIYAAIQLPFDLLGGYLPPKRYGRYHRPSARYLVGLTRGVTAHAAAIPRRCFDHARGAIRRDRRNCDDWSTDMFVPASRACGPRSALSATRRPSLWVFLPTD